MRGRKVIVNLKLLRIDDIRELLRILGEYTEVVGGERLARRRGRGKS